MFLSYKGRRNILHSKLKKRKLLKHTLMSIFADLTQAIDSLLKSIQAPSKQLQTNKKPSADRKHPKKYQYFVESSERVAWLFL